jgi:hypothetical protein
MFTNPYFSRELTCDRHREMLAQAGQQRQARELARASQGAEGAERRPRRAVRIALWLRPEVHA